MRGEGGVPAVAELHDAAESALGVAADPDRDGAPRRARTAADGLEAKELAGERRALLRPARAHDADGLVAPRAAARVGRAQQLDLLAHPANARTADHAPGREMVERREHLGRQHRMAMWKHEHAGAESDPVGHPGHQGQRRQRLEKIARRWQREIAARVVGIARGDAPRDHHVIADPQRVVAERLHAPREGDDGLPARQRPVDGQVAADLNACPRRPPGLAARRRESSRPASPAGSCRWTSWEWWRASPGARGTAGGRRRGARGERPRA